MIWLRHELWEYNDGLGYRLADRSETDATGSAHREGTLRHVFYAPSPAAAKAQYWALRQLGPIIPSRFESDAPFTLAQLQAQLAQFPDDATLHGQPALHPDEEVETPAVAVAALAVPVAGTVVEVEAEDEAPQSLEPYPVIAHSEPALAEQALAEQALAEPVLAEPVAEPVAAQAEPDAVVEEVEPASNVVPIRAAANDAAPRPDTDAEPHSREMERQPVAASGAFALALAELGPAAASSGALALALAELEPTPHSLPDDGHPTTGHTPLSLVASQSTSTHDEPPASGPTVDGTIVSQEPATVMGTAEPLAPEAAVAEADVVEPLVPEPATSDASVAEPLVPEPVAAEKAVEPDPLGPITAVATKAKRRKTGFFGGLMRFVMLLIVLAAVIVGVGVATGNLDGPTLLAQARAVPDQVRNLSIVKTLLPG